MSTTDAIARRIETYRPRSLPKEVWDLASGPATALVEASAPTSPEDAKGLLSSLCTLLASPCGWTRVEAPDLTALLTDTSIETFADGFAGPSKTLENHVGRLRGLQRARVGITRQPKHRGGVRPASRSRLAKVHAVTSDLPLATLAEVFEAATGLALTRDRLQRLAAGVLACQATVALPGAGTVPGDSAASGCYLGAADTDSRTVVVRAKKPTRAAPKPLSGRQQLARSRADRKAYRRVHGGPRLAAHPDMSVFAPEVRAAIEGYRPQDLDDATWTMLRPLTIQMVAGGQPASPVTARNAATIVVAFLGWVWNLPERPDTTAPPSAIELLSSALVEAYAEARSIHGDPDSSRSTARAVLRRCVRSLDADSVQVVYPHTPVAPPYTPEECEEFAWLATSQPTPRKERNACYLLGLTLGAGLSSQELRRVRRCHITEGSTAEDEAHLAVTVTGRDGPRSVPIRRQYEPLVRRALELSADGPDDALVLGIKETRRNVTIEARRGLVTAQHGQIITIEPNRLRTTWLFACMNAAVPLADLLRLAGLRSARTLADLLPLCPPANTEVVASGVLAVADAGLVRRHQGVAK